MKDESNDKRIPVSLLLISILGWIITSVADFDFSELLRIDEASDARRILAFLFAFAIALLSIFISEKTKYLDAIVSKLKPLFGRQTQGLLASAFAILFLLVTEANLNLSALGESAQSDAYVIANLFFAVSAFLCVLYLILDRPSGSRNTQSSEDSPSEYDELVKFIDIRRVDRIVALKQRAASLIFQGYILLALIISIVLGVGYFIPIAGQITGEDATSSNSFLLASSRVDSLREARASLVDEISRNERYTKATRSEIEIFAQYSKSELEANPEDGTNSIGRFNELKDELTRNIQEGEAMSLRLTDIRSDLEIAVKLLPSDFNELGNGIKDDSTTRLLISANITRFGVLALAIYLVQILINLYRFNTRLAGYYRALADSLTLFDPSMDEIGTLVSSVAPPFDFGKEPNHMSKELVESVSEATKKIVDTVRRENS